MVINITIADKRPTVDGTPIIVCGNSGYSIKFTFDAEWSAYNAKTARFVYFQNSSRKYKDVPFTGDTVAVPKLSNITEVQIGVYAGDLRTTTPATVQCTRSILCGNAVEQITPEEKAGIQGQIGDLAGLNTKDKSSLVAAINEAAKSGGGSGGGSGEDGATFTPAVSAAGVLSWTNDKGLDNPAPVNIKGPKGDAGHTPEKGTDYFTEADKSEIATQAAALVVAPVKSVNGKTGAVSLSAADVKARPDSWMPTAQEVGALPSTYTPPDQTAEQVGADPKGTATSAVSKHNTAGDSHNDIRQELQAINARLTAFFDSDDTTLDELSEIVAYITSNKSLIESITTSKVSVSDIVNNLTTNVANKPLSAAQGVALKGLIDTLSGNLANYQPKGDYALATAIPTKVSQLTNDKGYLTSYTETDPTVPAWAKQSKKPTYTASEVGALPNTTVIPTVPTKVSAFTNDAGYLTKHQDISGKVDKTGLTLGIHTDGLIYLFVDGSPVGTGIELPSGGIDGYIDSENNIVFRNLPDGTYTASYEDEDGNIVAMIGQLVKDTNVYYTVTKNLTNCTISNSATEAIGGQSYSATITAKSGYELKSVSVTMGGQSVSVSGGNISIANVTGNIVITAVAEEVQASYTNLADPSSSDWWADSHLGSDGTIRSKAGYLVSNYIGPVNVGDVIYIKGIDLAGGTGAEYRSAPYKSDKTLHGSYGTATLTALGNLSGKPITAVTVTTTGGQFTNNKSDVKYWRIGGKLNGTASDVIITINEPIG